MNEMIININDLFNHRSFGASSEINSYNDFTGISGSFLLKESLVKTDLALNIDFQILECLKVSHKIFFKYLVFLTVKCNYCIILKGFFVLQFYKPLLNFNFYQIAKIYFRCL